MTKSIKEKERLHRIKENDIKGLKIDPADIKNTYKITIYKNIKNKRLLEKKLKDYFNITIMNFLSDMSIFFKIYDFKTSIYCRSVHTSSGQKLIISIDLSCGGRDNDLYRIGSFSFTTKSGLSSSSSVYEIEDIQLDSIKFLKNKCFYSQEGYFIHKMVKNRLIQSPVSKSLKSQKNKKVIDLELKIINWLENIEPIGEMLKEHGIMADDEYFDFDFKDDYQINTLILIDPKNYLVLFDNKDGIYNIEDIDEGILVPHNENLRLEEFLGVLYDRDFLEMKNFVSREDFITKFEETLENYKVINY